MNKVALFTAIFGQYDKLQPRPDIPGVDFICFTDDPKLYATRYDWWVVPVFAPKQATSRMAAKFPKVLGPQCCGQLASYDYTVWIDASHVIKSPTFVDEALADLGPDGFALHRHEGRNNIADEAEASLRVVHKYDGQPIMEQAEHYRRQGFPDDLGLWACGSMARARSEKLDQAMRDWWQEIRTWSVQDQISLPYVCWKNGIRPHSWPHRQYDSPWLDILAHADST